jgi:pyruvate dehydrogenase E1 component
LQHQDGHSHVLASTVPTVQAYDPAYAFELAVIIQDGIRRMYEACEDIFYYLTLYNEPYAMPPMPEGAREGILRGLYKLRPAKASGERQPPDAERSASASRSKVHLFGSGALLREALHAQDILAERYGIAADVWSVTSYKQLRRDALETERWNMLHPEAEPKKSYLERLLQNEQGVFVAVSDYKKLVPDMISRWVPGGLFPLGTDGFGRSDNRASLRRFFEVDAECIVVAVLWRLAQRGQIKPAQVQKALKELDIDPEKANPLLV